MIQIEVWHLVMFLIAFFGFAAGAYKMISVAQEKRMAEQFKALADRLDIAEQARKEAAKQWNERFTELAKIEREVLTLKAELPLRFVMREDYVRGQTVIEAKLDRLFTKMELVQTRGNPQ